MKKLMFENKGFTLVEMLIYMGIFSILLVVFTGIFSSILDTHSESQATSAIDQDGNYITAKLTYDIHQATTIVSPALGGSSSTLHITGSSLDNTYTLDGNNNLLVNGVDHLNSQGTTVQSIIFTTLGNTASQLDPSPKNVALITFILKSTTVRRGGASAPGNQPKTFQITVGTR